jgi:type I restriction enzyme S subunit
MANEWKDGLFVEIAEVEMGQSPPGEDCNDSGYGLPLLNGPTEFGSHHPTPVQFTTNAKKVCQPGDLLFCVRGSTTGRMNWADQKYAIGRGIAAIRHREGTGLHPFLKASVDMSLPILLAAATGSTFPNVSKGQIEEMKISIPPLSEQRAIAQVLGTLDDKIECNRRLNRSLEGIVRALFKSWFIDFDPVIDKALAAGNPIPDEFAERAVLRQQAAAEYAKPLPEELRALFPDEFSHSDGMGPASTGTTGNWIPKGWELAPLSSIATNPRRTVQPADVAPETPYIGLEHMPRRSISLDAWGRAADVASGKSKFNQGEILFGKLRPYFHKVGLAPVSGVCSTDILVVAPKLDCWHTFILALVSSKAFVDYTDQCSAGTKMPRTNWTDMARYGIAMPSKRLAEAFQQHTAKMLRHIAFAVRQNQQLSTLRDTLLPKLLSGEIRVPGLMENVSYDT